MPRPVLTEYLLKLSTNQIEFDRFRDSQAEALRSMKDAGLSERHQEMLLRADTKELLEAIVEELRALRPQMSFSRGPLEVTVSLQFVPLVVPPRS